MNHFTRSAVIIRLIRDLSGDYVIYAHGSRARVYIFVKQVVCTDVSQTLDPWSFIGHNPNQYICGYVPYEACIETNDNSLNSFGLFMPDSLIIINHDLTHRIVLDNLSLLPSVLIMISKCTHPSVARAAYVLPAITADDILLDLLTNAFEWVRHEPNRRLTVSKRFYFDWRLSLVDLFSLSHPVGIQRSYYYYSREYEFTGTSPELLVNGNQHHFFVNKLSGTSKGSYSIRRNYYSLTEMVGNDRIKQEHRHSISATLSQLEKLGSCTTTQMQVLQLPLINHLMTSVSVYPTKLATRQRCIQTLMQTGASPKEEGIAKIAQLEGSPRKAYYGLCGFITPQGYMNFSQVIRTLFRDGHACFAQSGSAVMSASNIRLETEEILLKATSTFLAYTGFTRGNH
jgi:hypothetical protein